MASPTLAVVNSMLGLLGELPLNALDEPHPLIPAALAALDAQTTLVQSDFWWFNVEYPTLTPQVGSGMILVPPDAASVVPDAAADVAPSAPLASAARTVQLQVVDAARPVSV